jgi:hypothetical protein
VIINNATDIFQIAAGYATGSTVLPSDSTGVPKDLPVIMVKSHALALFEVGAPLGIEGQIVPLKCVPSEGDCYPILPEERDLKEVDSGYLHVAGLEPVEFLSGTWGAILPEAPLRIVLADPANACAPLTNVLDARGALVLVNRGGCGFGEKALAVQGAKGGAMAVVDKAGSVLMRMGATNEQMATVGLAGMMVSYLTGQKLIARAGSLASIAPHPGMSALWLELLELSKPLPPSELEVLVHQLLERNAGSPERLAWIENKRASERNAKKPKTEF